MSGLSFKKAQEGISIFLLFPFDLKLKARDTHCPFTYSNLKNPFPSYLLTFYESEHLKE